jgi:hypothetical protein
MLRSGLTDVASRSFRRWGEVWLPSMPWACDAVFFRRTFTTKRSQRYDALGAVRRAWRRRSSKGTPAPRRIRAPMTQRSQ